MNENEIMVGLKGRILRNHFRSPHLNRKVNGAKQHESWAFLFSLYEFYVNFKKTSPFGKAFH